MKKRVKKSFQKTFLMPLNVKMGNETERKYANQTNGARVYAHDIMRS